MTMRTLTAAVWAAMSVLFPMVGCALAGRAAAAESPSVPKLDIVDRVSCSSLCQAKQPLETMCRSVAGMGYRWVDLSCLSWAPHVNVPVLAADFEKEASHVETVLKAHGLRASNLTYDPIESLPWDEYRTRYMAVIRLAARLKARLVNLMAPGAKCDRNDAVAKLRVLQGIAAQHKVILTVETHCNQITERPADALWLCRQVPGLGLTLDPSHYYAGPHQGGGFEELYPLVQGTGFRAGGMTWQTIQSPWGTGPIDFVAIVRRLEACGYKGFYVVEYIEGFNAIDALVESRKFLAWARGL